MSESIIGWMNSAHVFIPSAELSKAFIVFLIFSSIGWICEVCYVGIFFEHKFVNRGFLFGPLCPVYGIGGILILLTPEKLQNPVWRLFITGTVLCSLVEYAASFVLEQMFHLKLWDYSDRILKLRGHTIKLNINGRVCLKNSLLFGVMTVSVIKFIQPLIGRLFSYFDDVYLQSAAGILGFAFAADIMFSVHRALDVSVYVARLKDFSETLKERYRHEEWFQSNSLHEMLDSIGKRALTDKEKFSAAMLEKIKWAQTRHNASETFVKRFPTLTSGVYKDSLTLIKKRLENRLTENIGKK